MRPIVTAASIPICAIILGGCGDGKTNAFDRRCASCHPRAANLASGIKGENEEARASGLDRFLQSHHPVSDPERAEIVAFLMGMTKK